ncbi:uncharacterized protein [Physcomitrium patens]|uniref:uncharacterized protein isoform X4 n=1 Tax=Physcomitrium patens TaxID=3218 RepID=UPI003CCD6053
MDIVRKFSGAASLQTQSLPSTSFHQDTASMQTEFEVEEEQVLNGLKLIYSDKINDAEDYFDTLRAGHARFSLHYAEVAMFVAVMSHDDDDINFAISLFQAAEGFASEQERNCRHRTHSNIKKVNETVSSMKSWALGKAVAVLEKSGFEKAAALSDKLKSKEENPDVKDAMSREETNVQHRLRRMRLWCLYIQAECFLFIGLLTSVWFGVHQTLAGGERWSSMVKVGYNLKRAWLIYKHSKKKLLQVQREWVTMGGTLQGELSGNLRANYDTDDDEQSPNSGSAVPSTPDSQSDMDEEGWQIRQPRLSESEMIEMGAIAASGNLQKLEGNIKEDQELASLRIGIEFGMGAFNLIVSLIPAQYHKALELLGMPGDRARAIILLNSVSTTHHPRAPLAALMLLLYHTVVMAFLPPIKNHMEIATSLLNNMEPNWKGGCIIRVVESRLARYEGNLQMSSDLLSNHTVDMNLRGFNLRLRNLMLEEMGWCLMLQGHYEKAAMCFDSLFKETAWFKPFYCCLRSACLWESSEPGSKQEGGRLLEDVTTLLSAKKGKLSSVELFVSRLSTDYVTLGLVPLHPALELIAVYNGFHQMSQLRLKELAAQLDAELRLHSNRTLILNFMPQEKQSTIQAKFVESIPQSQELVPTQLYGKNIMKIISSVSTVNSAAQASSSRKAPVEHNWVEESMITCRYLLALCLINLRSLKPAEDHLRKVVAATDIIAGSKITLSTVLGNIAPYACYELGSMLLDRDTSGDGLSLLEKSTSFPFHDFQTRLKFVVGERLKRFH